MWARVIAQDLIHGQCSRHDIFILDVDVQKHRIVRMRHLAANVAFRGQRITAVCWDAGDGSYQLSGAVDIGEQS